MRKTEFTKQCQAKCGPNITIEDCGMLAVLHVRDPKDHRRISVPLDLKTAEAIWRALDEWMNT